MTEINGFNNFKLGGYNPNYFVGVANFGSVKGKLKFRDRSIQDQFLFFYNFFVSRDFQILFSLQSVTNFVIFCNSFIMGRVLVGSVMFILAK